MQQLTRLIVLGAIAALLSGCTAATAGTAAIVAVPRLLNLVGDGKTVEREARGAAVRDDRSSWIRSVTDARGNPIHPGAAGTGDVLVVWDVPVRVGAGVEAVAGLGRIECAYDPNVPVRWELLRRASTGVGTPVGEAWRAAYVASSSATSSSLAPLQAEALAMQMQVTGGYRLTWLLLVPSAGDYILRASWAATGDGLQGEPCIDAWGAVDLGSAISATAPASSSLSQAPRPRTPYEAWLRSQQPATPSASPVTPEQAATPPAISTEALDQQLGLLGVPEYDLVRLHQAALEFEVTGYIDRALLPTLMARRARAIELGLATAPQALCRAARQHALDQRGLKAWSGEPTLPPLLAQEACSR